LILAPFVFDTLVSCRGTKARHPPAWIPGEKTFRRLGSHIRKDTCCVDAVLLAPVFQILGSEEHGLGCADASGYALLLPLGQQPFLKLK
jgi:hypothetical protein